MYRYSLDKKSKKFVCPKCGKKRLVKYVDNLTGGYLDDIVGRCDREVNCSYHFTPKLHFADSKIKYNSFLIENKQVVKEQLKPTFHNNELLQESLKYYDSNNFFFFLNRILGSENCKSIIEDYKIGTANYWNNGTIFWQLDLDGKIKAGKIIIYQKTGKRTKYINWVHSHLKKKGMLSVFNLQQCLFGEHLLRKNKKPVAIVESEKTACIMSQLFYKYTWLATGSLGGLTEEKIACLKQRKVVLYPDLGIQNNGQTPFDIWTKKANHFAKEGYDISVSDLLENSATDNQKSNGLDIADYFLVENKLINLGPIPKVNSNLEELLIRNNNLKILVDAFDLVEHVNYPSE